MISEGLVTMEKVQVIFYRVREEDHPHTH